MSLEESRFEQLIEALIVQRNGAVPKGCGWAEYEIAAIRGKTLYQVDAWTAIAALGFIEREFDTGERQAVCCTICGGLFDDSLDVMRRHRIDCGWRSKW